VTETRINYYLNRVKAFFQLSLTIYGQGAIDEQVKFIYRNISP